MHIETYESPEEMEAALERHRQHALDGLHTVQANLSWGDHWVRFVDLDAAPPVVEFGRVMTREEIAFLELARGAVVDPDAKWEWVVDQVNDMVEQQERGYLFGVAWSVRNPEGDLGTTHKAHVWPIEERLFDMVEAEEWNINGLDETGRFLLDLAFRQHRAHFLSLREGQR